MLPAQLKSRLFIQPNRHPSKTFFNEWNSGMATIVDKWLKRKARDSTFRCVVPENDSIFRRLNKFKHHHPIEEGNDNENILNSNELTNVSSNSNILTAC